MRSLSAKIIGHALTKLIGMQDTTFQSDLQKIESAKEAQFVDNIIKTHVKKGVVSENYKKVKALNVFSFLPQFISLVTASFFIIYVLSGYSLTARIVLISLLILIAGAVEYGKRVTLREIGKGYFLNDKLNILFTVGLVILVTVSCYVSYQGGNKLIVENDNGAELVHNPKIDSLNNLLAAELETIKRLQNTTWKGVITRSANKGINESKKIQSVILSQINALEEKDEKINAGLQAKHESKITNMGYLTGGAAILADLVLIVLLLYIEKLKADIIHLHTPPKAQKQYKAPQAAQIGFSRNKALQNEIPTDTVPERPTMGFKKQPTDTHGHRGTVVKADCKNCMSEFIRTVPHKVFCSTKCRHEYHNFKLK